MGQSKPDEERASVPLCPIWAPNMSHSQGISTRGKNPQPRLPMRQSKPVLSQVPLRDPSELRSPAERSTAGLGLEESFNMSNLGIELGDIVFDV